jgi:hypothetical protein
LPFADAAAGTEVGAAKTTQRHWQSVAFIPAAALAAEVRCNRVFLRTGVYSQMPISTVWLMGCTEVISPSAIPAPERKMAMNSEGALGHTAMTAFSRWTITLLFTTRSSTFLAERHRDIGTHVGAGGARDDRHVAAEQRR